MKKFGIQHKPGYTLERNKHGLSKASGIYVVYKCDYDSLKDRVDVKEVIYIGESQNIYDRHITNKHEHYEDFVREAGGKEHICYGEILLPDVSDEDRKTIEAAMIHRQKPKVNDEKHKAHYAKPASDITMTGGPDCWKTKHFIHEHDGDDEIGFDTLTDFLRLNLGSK